MLLIDLLVQELPKRGGWPAGAVVVMQDDDGTIKFAKSTKSLQSIQGNWSSDFGEDWFYKDRPCERNFRVPPVDGRDQLITREQYEAALKPVWDGTGTPPVGTECELVTNGRGIDAPGLKDGDTVKVIAHFLNHNNKITNAVTYLNDRGNTLCTGIITPCLRPIRTERDKFVDSVSEILKPSPIGVDAKLAAVKLWNAGYRKV